MGEGRTIPEPVAAVGAATVENAAPGCGREESEAAAGAALAPLAAAGLGGHPEQGAPEWGSGGAYRRERGSLLDVGGQRHQAPRAGRRHHPAKLPGWVCLCLLGLPVPRARPSQQGRAAPRCSAAPIRENSGVAEFKEDGRVSCDTRSKH